MKKREEALVITMEECGELTQACSKVLRTRKIKQHTDSQWYNPNNFYNYFCDMCIC